MASDPEEATLSLLERRTLSAVFVRLLPPGEGPGAVEAGAVEYVDRLFRDGAPELRPLTAGLGLLEGLALERHGLGFASLEPQLQDEVLRELQSGDVPRGERLLRQLVFLALEGTYCHPARGGNLHGVGWRSAGLDTATTGPDPRRCRVS